MHTSCLIFTVSEKSKYTGINLVGWSVSQSLIWELELQTATIVFEKSFNFSSLEYALWTD